MGAGPGGQTTGAGGEAPCGQQGGLWLWPQLRWEPWKVLSAEGMGPGSVPTGTLWPLWGEQTEEGVQGGSWEIGEEMPVWPRGATVGLTWVGHGGDEERSDSVYIVSEMPQEVPKAGIRVPLASSVLLCKGLGCEASQAQALAQQS